MNLKYLALSALLPGVRLGSSAQEVTRKSNFFRRLTCTLLTVVGSMTCVYSQNVALKSNLVSDVLLSPNIGIEIGLAPRWTLNASGQLNLWTVGNGHKWRHWLVQPEARYWFCQRFAGHFVGIHTLGGEYNVGKLDLPNFLGMPLSNLKDRRYEGWFAGTGVAYGYAWPVSKHWNIEAEIGLGWIWTRYDAYPCAVCGSKLESKTYNHFAPTKLAVNIEYIF